MTTETTPRMYEIVRTARVAAERRMGEPRFYSADVEEHRWTVDLAVDLLSAASSSARAAWHHAQDGQQRTRDPGEENAHIILDDPTHVDAPVRMDPGVGLAKLEDLAIVAAVERLRAEIKALRGLSGEQIAERLTHPEYPVRFVPALYGDVERGNAAR